MKVLITGGYGFIGSHIADRFYKEGHEIFIIDNLSSGNIENISFKHKFYNLNVEDRDCEKVFKANKFDIVVHLSNQIDVRTSIEHPYLEAKSNILGLINILELSVKYNVKKFIFASSAAVYGDTDDLPIIEDSKKNPLSPYGISKLTGEYYLSKWNEIYGLNTVVFRFSNVYGPRQAYSSEDGVISSFMKNIINNEEVTIYGDGNQTRDFIYVEDLVDCVFKSAFCKECRGVYNLSSNTEISINEIVNFLNKFTRVKKVVYKEKIKGDIDKSRLDNSLAKEVFGWEPIYTFEEGIEKTYKWFKNVYKKINNEKENEKKEKFKKLKIFKNKILPYIENFLLFALIYYIELKLFKNDYRNFNIFMDLNLLYILIIGIIYGQKQAILSIILASIAYIYNFLSFGGDITSLVYVPTHLIRLSLYILIGVLTGYTISRKNQEIYFRDLRYKTLKEKYSFIKQLYNETRIVKEELHEQIVNSKDSFGKIYSVIEKIQHLDNEKIYIASINAIEEFLKTKKVAIYLNGESKRYLRLKSKSNSDGFEPQNSVDLEKDIVFKKVIDSKKIFVNRDLLPNVPLFIGPIINENAAIGFIAIYETEFENITLYYENLFKTIIKLIEDSLSKAYLYEKSIKSDKYIKGTLILNNRAFNEAIDKLNEKKRKLNMNYALFRIEDNSNVILISKFIEKIIRKEDILGLGKDKKLYIAFVNVKEKDIRIISEKLSNNGFEYQIMEEIEYDN